MEISTHKGPLSVIVISTCIFVTCFLDVTYSLKCWHCIAEECHLNPYDYDQAESRVCQPGQSCQKVVFEMFNYVQQYTYRSTVRSCADQCIPQDDFENCTDIMHQTRGCVLHLCCDDSDMCNFAIRVAPCTDFVALWAGHHVIFWIQPLMVALLPWLLFNLTV